MQPWRHHSDLPARDNQQRVMLKELRLPRAAPRNVLQWFLLRSLCPGLALSVTGHGQDTGPRPILSNMKLFQQAAFALQPPWAWSRPVMRLFWPKPPAFLLSFQKYQACIIIWRLSLIISAPSPQCLSRVFPPLRLSHFYFCPDCAILEDQTKAASLSTSLHSHQEWNVGCRWHETRIHTDVKMHISRPLYQTTWALLSHLAPSLCYRAVHCTSVV